MNACGHLQYQLWRIFLGLKPRDALSSRSLLGLTYSSFLQTFPFIPHNELPAQSTNRPLTPQS